MICPLCNWNPVNGYDDGFNDHWSFWIHLVGDHNWPKHYRAEVAKVFGIRSHEWHTIAATAAAHPFYVEWMQRIETMRLLEQVR
jgi:hypothetical protein